MKSIAVIGAGIIGICTAHFLQKSGLKVSLFDMNEPGSMTSYGHACTFADYACVPVNSHTLYKELPFMLLRNDGPLSISIPYILKNLPWAISFLKNCKKEKVEYIASSLASILSHAKLSYEEIFREVDVSQYIKDEAPLYLYKTNKDYQLSIYTNDLRRRNGVKVKELNSDEIKEIEPNLAPIYFKGVLFEGSRHTINPLMLSKKIFEDFIKKGGIFINKKINSINAEENNVQISSNNISYNFDKITISAGAWSKKLAAMIGDRFPLDIERGYHILFENKEKLINRPIGWSQSGFYIVQIDEGIRAAGTVEIAGFNKEMNKKRLAMIEEEARKIIPDLGKVKSNWLGFRPTLPDSIPVIGQSQKNKNILYAFGHQHIGWTLAAITGKLITELAQDRNPNIDITPFSPDRFN